MACISTSTITLVPANTFTVPGLVFRFKTAAARLRCLRYVHQAAWPAKHTYLEAWGRNLCGSEICRSHLNSMNKLYSRCGDEGHKAQGSTNRPCQVLDLFWETQLNPPFLIKLIKTTSKYCYGVFMNRTFVSETLSYYSMDEQINFSTQFLFWDNSE